MNDLDFGLELPEDSLLIRVLREAKKTDHLTGRSILYQAYETTFGVFDYMAQAMTEHAQLDPDLKRPLASVALHFAEDVSSTSRLYELIRAFKDRKVYSVMGLSLTEFLDLPHDICEFILTECNKQQERDTASAQQVINDLNQTR